MLEVGIAAGGPRISIALSSSEFHDSLPDGETASSEQSTESLAFRAPSQSGLALYSSDWQIGFNLAGMASGLNGRLGVTFIELGVQLQTVVQLGLAGLTWLVGGEWHGSVSSVGANVSVNPTGVELRVEYVLFH